MCGTVSYMVRLMIHSVASVDDKLLNVGQL